MVVLKNEGLKLVNYCNTFGSTCELMALSKALYSTSFLGYSEANECQRFVQKGRNNVGFGCIGNITKCGGLSLRGCSDRHDGSAKARALLANNRYLLRDPGMVSGEGVGLKLVNGNGRPLEFPSRSVPEKMVVAVDVDEVLGSFLSAINKFIADRYSLKHSLSEYHVYEFFRRILVYVIFFKNLGADITICIVCSQIWNCSRAEADIRVHEFFKTHYFTMGIHPIPGAWHALHRLSAFCSLSVVTSRQNVIKDHTLDWLEKHYPGLFEEIHFGNHFALEGQSKPKSEICRSLGAQVLIDDNPRYALECAEVGIRVLLFDFDNSYPWSKCDTTASHPLVTKVKNWEEVEEHVVSWTVS